MTLLASLVMASLGIAIIVVGMNGIHSTTYVEEFSGWFVVVGIALVFIAVLFAFVHGGSYGPL